MSESQPERHVRPARVVVLGGSGMLGSMVADVLARRPGLSVSATVRDENVRARLQASLPEVSWLPIRTTDDCLAAIEGTDWVVNAMGITKPLIREDVPAEVERAIEVNALLPHAIGQAAAKVGARVLQIATDAVYHGTPSTPLVETTPHDPRDVYGKTKSLGETRLDNVHHLRCSIVGPEMKDFRFLVEWFRRQPPGAEVRGFVNHVWNGVTTLQFARLCDGIIRGGVTLPHLHHVVPTGTISKAGMLHAFAAAFGRPDVAIVDVEAPEPVIRPLQTNDDPLNRHLWAAAGYAAPPTVVLMIEELAGFDYRPSGPSRTA